MPISTPKTVQRNWNCYKLAWKRTHAYFAPTHCEEDDKRGKKIPKDHRWRIIEESSIFGSSSVIPLDANKLFHHKCKCLEFAKHYRNLATNTQVGFTIKRTMPMLKITCT